MTTPKPVPATKSDSTRKPKLPPKVWVRFGNVNSVCIKRPWYWGGVHQYAPVQKPRRCVWKLQHNSATNGYTACGWWMDRDSTLKFCARCGRRIVRRKS